MPELSIIVPVYKTEKYLSRCINSILTQTFSKYELILVDDGSPDNCGIICDEYASKDSRIHVIHKNNRGVSAARNTGLEIATGEYITFVDSDDWLDSQMYECMMEKAHNYNCDVVMCDCLKEYEWGNQLYSHDIRGGYYNNSQLKKEYYSHLLIMENTEYPPTISNYLCIFRKEIIASDYKRGNEELSSVQDKSLGELRYVEGVRNCEDLLFGAEMMYRATSFYYMKGAALYHYCYDNQQSASRQFNADMWSGFLKLHKRAKSVFLNNKGFDFSTQLDLLLLSFLYTAVGNIRTTRSISYIERRKAINKMLKEKEVKEMFERIRISEIPISWKLKVYTVIYKYRIGVDFVLLKG